MTHTPIADAAFDPALIAAVSYVFFVLALAFFAVAIVGWLPQSWR